MSYLYTYKGCKKAPGLILLCRVLLQKNICSSHPKKETILNFLRNWNIGKVYLCCRVIPKLKPKCFGYLPNNHVNQMILIISSNFVH